MGTVRMGSLRLRRLGTGTATGGARRRRRGIVRGARGASSTTPGSRVVRRPACGLATAGIAAWIAGCGDASPPPTAAQAAYAEIVAEEDARGDIGFERVRAHLDGDDPAVRAMAVRALGRQEDRAWTARLGDMLDDPDPAVRMAAAAALAQSVYGEDPGEVVSLLAGRVGRETDAAVVGALATNIGRLAFASAEQREAGASALAATGRRIGELAADPGMAGRLGLMRGIEAFARGGGPDRALPDELAAIARSPGDGGSAGDRVEARIRRLAAAALTHANQLTDGDIARLLADADWGVRRQALIAAARRGTAAAEAGPGDPDPPVRLEAVNVIMFLLGADPDARVRVEALRAYGERGRATEGCGAILAALDDPDPDVVATALDLLATPCPDVETQRGVLASRVAAEGGDDGDWRAASRALYALAAIAPGEAGDGIGRFARHGNPFARAWAARAAGLAGDVEALNRLAGDEDPNVREAALRGLGRVVGDGGREQYLAALETDDPQLVMTAAGLVAEHLGPDVAPGAAAQATQQAAPQDAPQATPRPASQGAPQPALETFVSDLLGSLGRFTAARRETERDARVALLEAIGAVGGFSPDDLTPYLADFDPVVADLAAALLTRSTGAIHEAAPERLPRTPPPDATRIAELAESQVVLHMAGLGAIAIALRPDLAATNADRFARLARAGYFDGLTFHRVVPNFVIQGGSPHANEYMGDGPYSRDEIGDHAHWRGTVGLSTRGRDTGDAQIFVNLVDNVRLDFNYTIFGEVVEGMEIVDAVREGAVIERAEVVGR